MSERTSERSGGRERSEQSGASERVSGASERANGRASGPVLQSVFLIVVNQSALVGNNSENDVNEAFGQLLPFCSSVSINQSAKIGNLRYFNLEPTPSRWELSVTLGAHVIFSRVLATL